MADLPAGTVLGERFEVIGVLGYGGMATVYLARDRVRGEEVALKVLHDHLARSASMRARLRREVRTASKLRSPHALVAWDIHELGGSLALSMRVHRGTTLSDHVQQRGPLPPDAVVRLGKELAAALGEAHLLGVVHRDVTPPNVLLDPSGAAVLTDFGLARSATQQTMTSTAVLGTAGYAAPEVYQGVRTDPRSDLYSLGAVLYFAATGRPPFEASDPMGVLRRQLDGDFAPLARLRPDLPIHVAATIESLVALEPHDRPGEASIVAARLDGLATETPLSFPTGDWAVDLESTRHSRPDDLARAFAEATGQPADRLPDAPALHEKQFTLVTGVDEATAHRLAGIAGSFGYVPGVVDLSGPRFYRPSLQALLASGAAGALFGLGLGLLMVLAMAVINLTGPWVQLPYGMPSGVTMSALLLSVVVVLGAVLPMLGSVWSIAARLRRPATPEELRRPSPPSPAWTVPLAGLLGTVQVGLPVLALWIGLYVLAFNVPPLLDLPRGMPVSGPVFEKVLMGLTTGWWVLAVVVAGAGSMIAAIRYRSLQRPFLSIAYEGAYTPAVRPGASIVERVEAELHALDGAIARAVDRLPAAASYDLTATVRQLTATVAEMTPQVTALQDELRRLEDGRTIAEIERLEARLARARTLAHAGDPIDVASLEQALAAHLDVLAQADVAEDRLTRLTARLLEVISVATRCRLELLTDDGVGERARDLATRLGSDLDALAHTVAEMDGVARPKPVPERLPVEPLPEPRLPVEPLPEAAPALLPVQSRASEVG